VFRQPTAQIVCKKNTDHTYNCSENRKGAIKLRGRSNSFRRTREEILGKPVKKVFRSAQRSARGARSSRVLGGPNRKVSEDARKEEDYIYNTIQKPMSGIDFQSGTNGGVFLKRGEKKRPEQSDRQSEKESDLYCVKGEVRILRHSKTGTAFNEGKVKTLVDGPRKGGRGEGQEIGTKKTKHSSKGRALSGTRKEESTGRRKEKKQKTYRASGGGGKFIY